MGWASGSRLFEVIAPKIRELPDVARKAIYEALVEAANDMDWDTQNEVEGLDPVLDEILGDLGYLNDED